jgi:hypothetical protein
MQALHFQLKGAGMPESVSGTTVRLLAALQAGEVPHQTGYLVGLDRPALLAPDPGALLAARREGDILARGHRWRVVTESLWHDLLDLGQERPEQQVHVIDVADIESWLDDPSNLADIDTDGWRGNQGQVLVLPILT